MGGEDRVPELQIGSVLKENPIIYFLKTAKEELTAAAIQFADPSRTNGYTIIVKSYT